MACRALTAAEDQQYSRFETKSTELQDKRPAPGGCGPLLLVVQWRSSVDPHRADVVVEEAVQALLALVDALAVAVEVAVTAEIDRDVALDADR